ncbi:MAG: D-aminoacyl-tRNA deacylase [Candidatus Cloacimonadota bacterium]|jgi:D-tyrosyl-tRNA(Tyr) deacylase|nr:D-aminoacyl-tRNA deacylase [Candidatus Cloacimonadota bacterium]NMD12509.1 D-tyrosyl-tRNA(Tyr) deacylase [Candidatus Cloacimonadota bacterium]
MRVLIQRVGSASVEVENRLVGSIGPGLLLFVGFGHSDSPDLLPQAVRKISEMRVFSDDNGKLNLSLRDIGGQALIVSQFTLYANCSRGRRPDFTPAADPAIAEQLYDRFVALFRETGIEVQTGIFAADMRVNLINDGPVTFFLEF